MTRFSKVLVLVALAAILLRAADAFAAGRPNVLFLFSDDQRFDTIHALGNTEVETPNLDRLVQGGFTFTHAYCMGSMSGAVCLPSRAMVMSGRSLFHTDMQLEGVDVWPEVMRNAGYATFGTGKWHNGPAAYARGFTDGGAIFFGGMSDHDKVPIRDFDPSGSYAQSAYPGAKFSSALFADAAIDFLGRYQDEAPFFVYVAFTAPHDPRTPPGQYATMYDPDELALPESFMPQHPFDNGEMTVRDEKLAPWPRTPKVVKQHIADYYGMITHMDSQVGRVLAALEASGRADNTIVVFSSDHGLAVGRHGLLGKQNLYDHSMHSPLVFTGPGVPAGRSSDAFAYLFDIFPTVCDLADVPVPGSVEGKSLARVISGSEVKVRDAIFGAYKDVQRSIRDRRWKLIRYPQVDKTQLFDLENDPQELQDLSGDPSHAQQVARMTALLERHQRELDDMQTLVVDNPKPQEIDLTAPRKRK